MRELVRSDTAGTFHATPQHHRADTTSALSLASTPAPIGSQTLTIDNALAIMLAALALLGLGIYGPGIATGLVSGAPQLGAGAVAGTALAAGGVAVAAGAAAVGAGAGGARLARGIGAAVRSQGGRGGDSPTRGPTAGNAASGAGRPGQASGAPAWAQRLRSNVSRGSRTAAQTVRSADRPGAGAHPDLSEKKDE